MSKIKTSLLQIGSLPALIAAAVSLSDASSVDVESPVNNQSDDGVSLAAVYGTNGFVIAFAILAILLEVLLIVVRFCNIGIVNIKIKVFLVIVREVLFDVHVC